MDDIGINRRRHSRYDTEMEVHFKVKYDVNIRVEFEVVESHHDMSGVARYFGLCNNVSAEGILIVSKKQLMRDDILLIEAYEPKSNGTVNMEGKVRWCEKCPGANKEHDMFYAGVHIVSVNGKSVADSIYFDKKHMVVWSVLLESLFGTFSAIKKQLD